jgi:hypothetical protein
MKVQTFIFVHDQNIILDCIATNKFLNLENLKFVFVGSGDIDKVVDLPNVFIARHYEDNREDYPKLTSYTGWYFIWKNKLYDADYINLFEYDIDITEDFSDRLNEQLIPTTKVVGYIPYSVHNWGLFKTDVWIDALEKSLFDKYNIQLIPFINSLSGEKICSMTSNHTFEKHTFEQYMKWVEPMIDDIKNHERAGHQVERSIPLFYLLNEINEVVIIPNIMHHYQKGSHGT